MNVTRNEKKDEAGEKAANIPLPTVKTVGEESATRFPASSIDAEPAYRPRLLLLVEDDWRTHSALRKLLTKKGWEVHSAMTIAGGLALLYLKPEAIILDLMLPDGDGAEVLRQVRALGLATRVVITTGVEDRTRLEEIRKLGPDALLRKPLEFADLLRAIDIGRKG